MSREEFNSKETIHVIPPKRIYDRIEPGHQTGRRSLRLVKSLLLIVAMGLLIAGGGVLLYYLSKNPVDVTDVPDQKVTSESNPDHERRETIESAASPALLETTNTETSAFEKKEAEEKMTDFMGAKKALDAIGGIEWGGNLYVTMTQLSEEAEALFLNKDYASASRKYMEALSMVNGLTLKSNEALNRLLEEGRQAMSEGNGKLAVNKFNVALMIDPGNELAHLSLERAKKIESVTRLIESGKRHEKQGNLPFALTDYQEALALDPQSEAARMAFDRVKGLIAQDQFQQLMSAGFAALHNRDLEAARAAFLKAQSFKPNSSEVQDALTQVDQAIRLDRIEALREKALAAEKLEAWDRALEAYLSVLKIDNTIQFALQGKAYSLERSRIDKNLAFYLEKPALLESDSHLENAVLVLQQGAKIEPKGPRMTAQIEKLDRLVNIAKTPVRITLESDNLTEVAVYRVGRLGKFYTRDLDLRPGTYTVVGTRDGYKDVRRTMVVKAGEKNLKLTLKCE
ncbi:MAG: hypothetical protein AMK69_24230, partial [Nitrospira bacterium SG8_3]